jgi:kinesin family member 18/19
MDQERDDSPNTAQKPASNIMVAVRLRPISKSEGDSNEVSIVRILDEKLVILRDPSDFDDDFIKNELRKNRSREKRYAFDFAFDERTETDRVFQLTALNMCTAVLDGFNSTVFAYGATGAGKTHTMLGSADKPGIMYLTMQELFAI